MFQAISPLYDQDRAATITFAGTLYGLGCVLTALLAAGTYSVYTTSTASVPFRRDSGVLYRHLFAGEIRPSAATLAIYRSGRCSRTSRIPEPFYSPSCCSFSSVMNGQWRVGCLCF